MGSTTVRIDEPTHKLLQELAEHYQMSMEHVIAKALEAYRRQLFWAQARHEFNQMSNDPQAWQAEQEERQLWDQTLGDGLCEEEGWV